VIAYPARVTIVGMLPKQPQLILFKGQPAGQTDIFG